MTASTSLEPRSPQSPRRTPRVRPPPACPRDCSSLHAAAIRARSSVAASSKFRQFEPGGLAGVGAEDRRAAGVGDHADPGAARQWLRRRERGCIKELAQGLDPDDAGVREQNINTCTGARDRGPGVRGDRASAHTRAPGMHGEHRLVGGQASRDASKVPRVAKRLEIEQHDVGRGVVLPVLEDVVRRQSGRLPIDTKDDSPRPSVAACSMSASPTPPLCESRPTRPGGGASGANVALIPRLQSRREVRADQPHAPGPAGGHEGVLAPLPLGTGLREPALRTRRPAHPWRQSRATLSTTAAGVATTTSSGTRAGRHRPVGAEP